MAWMVKIYTSHQHSDRPIVLCCAKISKLLQSLIETSKVGAGGSDLHLCCFVQGILRCNMTSQSIIFAEVFYRDPSRTRHKQCAHAS